MIKKRILVVDDDPHIREVIGFALEQEGMEVREAGNGIEALAGLKADPPDLVILDVMMPELDGLDVCKEIRKNSQVAILFLSARNEEIDRIIGLELGADDYVSKPFSPRELVSRVKAIFRRIGFEQKKQTDFNPEAESVLTCGRLVLNIDSHQALWGDLLIKLTAREFSLLTILMRHPNKVFERDALMDRSYSPDVIVCDRTIDSHVRGIRTKFSEAGCDDVIGTVHGVGYKIGSCL